jgi:hypothetical protein
MDHAAHPVSSHQDTDAILKGVWLMPIADTSISKKWGLSQTVLKLFSFLQLPNTNEEVTEPVTRQRDPHEIRGQVQLRPEISAELM